MALEFILLGMLRDQASGYDLRKAFEVGPRHFWSAELSQIYPTLQRMQRRGWLTSRRQASARGPARRAYRRTPKGTRALHAWLRGEPEIGTERLAYIGQLVFHGELGDPTRTLRFLVALRDRLVETLEWLESGEPELRRARAGLPIPRWSDDDFHELLCLRLGRHVLRARVAGCDECLRLVRARLRAGRSRRA
jgi:DNA-binding PadR family transcriptional regulator